MEILYVVGAVLVIGAAIWGIGTVRMNRSADDQLAQLCHDLGVPNVPFDRNSAVREVIAGTRPGIPRDGQWWVASGVGQVGYPSRTRLIFEDASPNMASVQAGVAEMFIRFGGSASTRPGLPGIPESQLLAPMRQVHPDVLIARITGNTRPFEAWLVAVPPHLIGSGQVR